MNRILFIGSTVADVVIRVPVLPRTGEDLHIISQSTALGGCAYNACHAARLLGSDAVLFSPTGSGVWGDWVRAALAKEGTVPAAPRVERASGCCYCLVDPEGERTFISEHGAEYFFDRAWFDLLGGETFDSAYVCGLEIEETTGDEIIGYLEDNPPRTLYFAPGPRICRIRPEKMARMIALHPVFHLNESEACQFTRCEDVHRAAAMIASLSGNDVIVTLGADGALWLHDGEEITVPGIRTTVVDTIGAGDSHVGAVMALSAQGKSIPDILLGANRMSCAVVSHAGAHITPQEWDDFQSHLA